MTTPSKWGDELLVNTTTPSYQINSVIAALTNGRFVVAWQDNSHSPDDPYSTAIRAQIFNADGSKYQSEFLANTTIAGSQSIPAITAMADSRFVISWTDFSRTHLDTSKTGIRAQIFESDGTKSGDEFVVNTITVLAQDDSDIATLTDGRFAVSWSDASASSDDNSGYAIRAQIFNSDGSKSGNEFLVNTSTTGDQLHSAISRLAEGRFVISWTDNSQTLDDPSGFAIRAQIFNGDGSKYGSEFLVNSTTALDQDDCDIAVLTDGRFVVGWRDDSQSGDDNSVSAIRAQIFNSDGSKSGIEFLANSTTANGQWGCDITALTDGQFVISWSDYSASGVDTSEGAIRAQAFNADGTKAGNEFLVNTTTFSNQGLSTSATLADGRFVVSWSDYSRTGGDTGNWAVRAQIFDPRDAGITLDGTPADDDYCGTVLGDTMWGRFGDDRLFGDAGDDWLAGNQGSDLIKGGAGRDELLGGSEDDILLGNGGNDNLKGGDGDDTLDGGVGRDRLGGSSGDDLLIGGAGRDKLNCGAGDDIMSGGVDQDRFIFAPTYETGRITDFEDNLDKLDLSAFGFVSAAQARSHAVNVAGDVVFTFSAGNVLIVDNISRAQLTGDDFIL